MSQPEWRRIWRQNFTDIVRLADFLELSDDMRQALLKRSNFGLNLPLRLAQKIEKGRLDDPLLRQFVPLQEEERSASGFSPDPVEEAAFRCSERMLHKYPGRALLVTTSTCAMHCRYCFRRHFEYAEGPINFEGELELLREDTSIEEVILSGGDPLSLSDERLGKLLDQLDSIPHVQRLRFHTRFPIGIPERVTVTFLEQLVRRSQVIMVIHANHPLELDHEVLEALSKIGAQGIPVLNQSVLLRGVNDSIETQVSLSKKLINHGIIPYYLHQLDRVEGASHFEVPLSEGRKIVQALPDHLPGYAVPRFVREVPGKQSKSSIDASP